MDGRAATFSQRELCQITGLDTVTVDTWLIRGILETTKVDGRVLRGRRLFSVLTIFDFHAEICREHGLVPLDFVGRVFCYGAAAVEHVNAIADRHHNTHVVLDQQNAAADRMWNGL